MGATRLMPTTKKRCDECLFCSSRTCHVRIVCKTASETFDEVACRAHVYELEAYADRTLPPSQMRTHTTSTDKLRRGEKRS